MNLYYDVILAFLCLFLLVDHVDARLEFCKNLVSIKLGTHLLEEVGAPVIDELKVLGFFDLLHLEEGVVLEGTAVGLLCVGPHLLAQTLLIHVLPQRVGVFFLQVPGLYEQRAL